MKKLADTVLAALHMQTWGSVTEVEGHAVSYGVSDDGPYAEVAVTLPDGAYGVLEGDTYGAMVGLRFLRVDLMTLSPTGKLLYGDDAGMEWCERCDDNLAYTGGLCFDCDSVTV